MNERCLGCGALRDSWWHISNDTGQTLCPTCEHRAAGGRTLHHHELLEILRCKPENSATA